jgi:hypothetical protein
VILESFLKKREYMGRLIVRPRTPVIGGGCGNREGSTNSICAPDLRPIPGGAPYEHPIFVENACKIFFGTMKFGENVQKCARRLKLGISQNSENLRKFHKFAKSPQYL